MVFTGTRNGGPLDVMVVGGGQARDWGSVYYQRRAGLSFAIFDAEDGPGEAWRHGVVPDS